MVMNLADGEPVRSTLDPSDHPLAPHPKTAYLDPMRVIGLTGGIGSGKSTVADLFSDLGAPIIDADKIAHALVEPGQPALAEISQQFAKVIDASGHLDRAALRQHVFTDPIQRQQLEAIIHPRVRTEINAQLQQLSETGEAYAIAVIPLLFEAKMTDMVDQIVVIDVADQQQIARVQARDGLDERTIRAIIDSQTPAAERRSRADHIIQNSTDTTDLQTQIQTLHQLFAAT